MSMPDAFFDHKQFRKFLTEDLHEDATFEDGDNGENCPLGRYAQSFPGGLGVGLEYVFFRTAYGDINSQPLKAWQEEYSQAASQYSCDLLDEGDDPEITREVAIQLLDEVLLKLGIEAWGVSQ